MRSEFVYHSAPVAFLVCLLGVGLLWGDLRLPEQIPVARRAFAGVLIEQIETVLPELSCPESKEPLSRLEKAFFYYYTYLDGRAVDLNDGRPMRHLLQFAPISSGQAHPARS